MNNCLYIVYLDEFGHIGPYISHDHATHKTHPAFGLGGFVLPANKVRAFSSFFFNLKKSLFDGYDIPEARRKAKEKGEVFQLSTWEKKGSKQYTVNNLQKYTQLVTRSTNRIINRITQDDGFLFYVGEAKRIGGDVTNPLGTYTSCLSEVIKRLDNEFKGIDAQFLIFMDDHESRANIVKKKQYMKCINMISTNWLKRLFKQIVNFIKPFNVLIGFVLFMASYLSLKLSRNLNLNTKYLSVILVTELMQLRKEVMFEITFHEKLVSLN